MSPQLACAIACEILHTPADWERSTGSSKGRGSRATGWFDDYLRDRGDGSMRSLALEGGIKGWAGAGEEYTALMEGYERSEWEK